MDALAAHGLTKPSPITPWVRPSDWLPLPDADEQSITMLVAVIPDTTLSRETVYIETDTGTYSVDWGDGTSTTGVTSGTSTAHAYDFDDSALDGTETSRGYKQAIITITVDTPGAVIETFYLGWVDPLTESGSYNSWYPHALDVTINAPDCTTLWSYWDTRPGWVEHIKIIAYGPATNMQGMFNGLDQLQLLELPEGFGSSATNIQDMFTNCRKLRTLTLPDGFGSVATNMRNAFSAMTHLEEIHLPEGFGAAATDCFLIFNSCYSLKELVFPDGCFSVVTFGGAIANDAHSLRRVVFGAGAGAAITNFNAAFLNCYSLEEVVFPSGFGGAITTMQNMFQDCKVITEINFPAGFGAVVTDISNAFNGCRSLKKMDLSNGWNTAVTNMATCFQSCDAIESIVFPSGFGASLAFVTNAFNGCFSLGVLTNFACPISFSLSYARFDAANLDAVYTTLPTVTAKTITVSDNYGTTGDTPSIATGKGWTVTG